MTSLQPVIPCWTGHLTSTKRLSKYHPQLPTVLLDIWDWETGLLATFTVTNNLPEANIGHIKLRFRAILRFWMSCSDLQGFRGLELIWEFRSIRIQMALSFLSKAPLLHCQDCVLFAVRYQAGCLPCQTKRHWIRHF